MATATILAIGLFSQGPPWVKAIAVPMVILFLAALALSYSRAAYIGIGAGIVVLVWLQN